MNMEGLRDKVVIVTGASSGIGEGISYQFALHGSKLSITGRNKEKLEKVAQNCITKGLPREKIIYTIGDIRDGEFRKALIEASISAFGRIDALINNAGIGRPALISEMKEDDYRRVLEVNQNVPYLLTQLALPFLKESKGNIVNISSIAGNATPRFGISAYAMTKAAINTFTKYLAIELAPFGIRANAISPGVVKTGMADHLVPDEKIRNAMWDREIPRTPAGRLGTPQDIAQAVVFLVSENASWITGENMIVDGGHQLYSKQLDLETK